MRVDGFSFGKGMLGQNEINTLFFLSHFVFVYLCTMVVYNVTISLDQEVSQEWLEWMRKTHVPDVMKTGHFRDCKICRVHGEEEGGITFAIMYTAFSLEDLNTYEEQHANRLQAEHTSKFSGKFASFRTTLSVLQEFK